MPRSLQTVNVTIGTWLQVCFARKMLLAPASAKHVVEYSTEFFTPTHSYLVRILSRRRLMFILFRIVLDG